MSPCVLAILAAATISACGDTTSGGDSGVPDLTAAVDASAPPDAAAPPDLATPDLRAADLVTADLATADQAMPDLRLVDLAVLADLTPRDLVSLDLVPQPDLALPDLRPPADLAVVPDMVRLPDFVTLPDFASPPDLKPSGNVVMVGQGGLTFSPQTITVAVGSKVTWVWISNFHNVVSGNINNCAADGKFCSPNDANCGSAPTSNAGTMYEHTFTQAGTYPYFCAPHCGAGMTGTVIVQ